MKTQPIEVVAKDFTTADRLMDILVDKTQGEVEGSREMFVRDDLMHVVRCSVEGEIG